MASFMDGLSQNSDDLSLESAVDQSNAVSIPESKNNPEDQIKYSKLVEFIIKEFGRSKDKRMSDEQRWLECYRNYRGVYGPTTQFTSTEKSKAFIKITKTKVQAAVAQITEVLFAGNKFPIGVEPTRIPIGADDAVSFDPQKPPQASLRSNPQMSPQIAKVLGPKKNILGQIEGSLESGTGTTPAAIIFEPAKDAARKMEKEIHDQLDETDASKHLRSAVNELALFGSMIMKGPLALNKEYPKWNSEGQYTPEFRLVPRTEFVSIWDAYPDADARCMGEMEKFIQRHRLSKSDLRALNRRPHFRRANIEAAIAEGPNYVQEWWEFDLTDDSVQYPEQRWEVLEYWGICDSEIAKEAGLTIPKEFRKSDQIQINAWICGPHVLRLVFNPFTPERIPYYITPYELNPYSIFGIGVAENMLDTQLLMNGFMRLAVDNAALSSNIVFEVNEDFLAPGQSMELFPGKVFRRTGGTQGQAVNATKFENTTQEVLMLFDKARQLSDEATGMPSYAHGMTGVQNVNRTASGMSMLMGAAAQNIKAVVRNIDDYLLAPLGRAYFAFNMQFNFDKDYVADLQIVAKGTESLMRNEIRSQRLLQLGQFAAQNPAMAPLVKWDYILREYVASLDLDEDKVVNDPRLAAIQALQLNTNATLSQGPQVPQDPNAQGPQGGIPNPNDPTGTGGGVIAPGNAPEPNAEGFTG